MAKHLVKCKICGKEFDLNQEQGVIVSARRYAHQSCFPQGQLVPMEKKPEDDPEYQTLIAYINQLFGNKCNWAMTKKYIKKFKDENGYTYSGILKSLTYFYEIKKNSIDKANGSIGIVPFVYQDAYNYYYSLYVAQQNLQNSSPQQFKNNEVVIKIKAPKSKGIFKKLFQIKEEDDEGEE